MSSTEEIEESQPMPTFSQEVQDMLPSLLSQIVSCANTFKSDYGNFSDGFRKAFHHEMISYTRRKDREFVELAKPRLSALLSGTPRQIFSLIPDAENGLFSRFCVGGQFKHLAHDSYGKP